MPWDVLIPLGAIFIAVLILIGIGVYQLFD